VSRRVLAALVAALALAAPASAFVTDSGFKLVESPTLFASMRNYTILGPEDLSAFALVPGPRAVLVGGSGYFGLVDFARGEPSVVWAWSVIGRVEAVAFDDSWSPSWYAASTHLGETIVVDARNPDFRKSYFTAGRAPVRAVDLGVAGASAGLAVVDSEGYLYVYRVPEPYWFEVGPWPRDGPLGRLSGYAVYTASFARVMDGSGNVTSDATRLSVVLSVAPESRVVAYAYYSVGDVVAPVSVYRDLPVNLTVDGENVTVLRSATLYYGVVLADYNILLGLEEAANATVNATVPPTKLKLLLVYSVVDRSPETGEVLNSTCYASLTRVFEPAPGEELVLGRVVLSEVEAGSVEECVALHGVELNPEGAYRLDFHPVMVLDASRLPKQGVSFGPGGDAWLVYYPVPAALSPLTQASLWRVYVVPEPLPGWPSGAGALVLATVGRYAYVYVVDDMLVPQATGSDLAYLEVFDLGSTVTAATLSWDGSSIFLGTSQGKLFWLEWSPEHARYVAKASMQVGAAEVTGVSYVGGGYVLVSTGDGLLQLVRAEGGEWYPVWRGPYGYDGVATGVKGLRAEAYTLDMVVAGPVAAGPPHFFVLGLAETDIVRATIRVEVKKVALDGQVIVEAPQGGTLEVYDSQGALVAVSTLDGGDTFVVYLEPGKYRFVLRVPGLGQVETEAEVTFPEYKGVISAAYREVLVTALVPPPAEGERYPADVTPGPLPGALIAAVPQEIDPNLGYRVDPKPVYAVTGEDGTAILVLWEGVSYQVQVSKPGFQNYTATIPPYGPARVTATLKPLVVEEEQPIVRYYDVRIRVVDDRGEPLSLARVEVYQAGNNTLIASLFTDENGVVLVRLREGSYIVKAYADGYLPKEAALSVPQTTEITLSLDPTTATKVKRMIPYIALVAGAIALVGALYALRERIARRLVEEEEYF